MPERMTIWQCDSLRIHDHDAQGCPREDWVPLARAKKAEAIVENLRASNQNRADEIKRLRANVLTPEKRDLLDRALKLAEADTTGPGVFLDQRITKIATYLRRIADQGNSLHKESFRVAERRDADG